MEYFWATKPDLQFIEEELVPGHVETFDGITNINKEVLFAASQVLPKSLMDAVNLDDDVISYTQDPPADLRDDGMRVLNEFNTKTKLLNKLLCV